MSGFPAYGREMREIRPENLPVFMEKYPGNTSTFPKRCQRDLFGTLDGGEQNHCTWVRNLQARPVVWCRLTAQDIGFGSSVQQTRLGQSWAHTLARNSTSLILAFSGCSVTIARVSGPDSEQAGKPWRKVTSKLSWKQQP